MADIRGILSNLYQRMVSGSDYYFVSEFMDDKYGLKGTNLEIAQNHPILTPALLFSAKLFSQVDFELENINTGKIIKDHKALSLLKNPNFYQTTIDFFETLYFMMVAQGYSVVYKKKVPGGLSYNSMYILNPDLIKWPSNYKTKMASRAVLDSSNDKIIYDPNGENESIYIRDLLFFYDAPNALNKNFFDIKSRLHGLRQALENTTDSLIAKNVILKTNGKELITGKAGSGTMPFTPEEKQRIEKVYQSNYGLSKTRKRAIVTRSDITHKSLHIPLRDLGLDEGIKVDGNLIYTALHIPKDILSLEAKKTTYNNYKESMVSFIQNEMQGTADYILGVFTRDLQKSNPNLKIKGSYKHLPVMQYILQEKYNAIKTKAEALAALRATGLPDETCLEMCDMDTNIKLKKVEQNENNGNNEEGNGNGNESS